MAYPCYPDPPVQIENPPTPFTAVVHPKPGRLYTVNGVALTNNNRFSVNFLINGEDGDVALHIDCRFNEKVIVRNSRRNGKWEHEERAGGLPISSGVPFEMMVMVERCRFMIAINGRHFTEYVHRFPLAFIDSLSIHGHVRLSLYRETNDPNTMGMSILPTSLPLKFVENNAHVYDLPGGFYNGRIIHLMGATRKGTFCFDFLPSYGSDRIGLHVSCRVAEGVVVLNSRENSQWQAEIRPSNMKFGKYQHFHLEINNYNGEYRLLLNGVSMAVFPVRHCSPESLYVLSVSGDVEHRHVAST